MARSLQMIKKQLAKLEAEANRIERERTVGVKAVAKVMRKYNLSMTDLTQSMNRRVRIHGLTGKPVPPKFRDKDGNTWTGRGRTPLWMVAAEKSGKKRASFLIQ
jgi:DNA-binding protein H-NS